MPKKGNKAGKKKTDAAGAAETTAKAAVKQAEAANRKVDALSRELAKKSTGPFKAKPPSDRGLTSATKRDLAAEIAAVPGERLSPAAMQFLRNVATPGELPTVRYSDTYTEQSTAVSNPIAQLPAYVTAPITPASVSNTDAGAKGSGEAGSDEHADSNSNEAKQTGGGLRKPVPNVPNRSIRTKRGKSLRDGPPEVSGGSIVGVKFRDPIRHFVHWTQVVGDEDGTDAYDLVLGSASKDDSLDPTKTDAIVLLEATSKPLDERYHVARLGDSGVHGPYMGCGNKKGTLIKFRWMDATNCTMVYSIKVPASGTTTGSYTQPAGTAGNINAAVIEMKVWRFKNGAIDEIDNVENTATANGSATSFSYTPTASSYYGFTFSVLKVNAGALERPKWNSGAPSTPVDEAPPKFLVTQVTPTVAYTQFTWAHLMIPSFAKNIFSVGKMRVTGTGAMLTPATPEIISGGQIVGYQFPAGLDWHPVAEAGYEEIANKNGVVKRKGQVGMHGFLKPVDPVDWEMFNNWTVEGNLIRRIDYDLLPESGFFFIYGVVPVKNDSLALTPVYFWTIFNNLEWETDDTWRVISPPQIDGAVLKEALKRIRALPSFHSNANHVKSILAKLLGWGKKAVDVVKEYGPAAIEAGEGLASFLA